MRIDPNAAGLASTVPARLTPQGLADQIPTTPQPSRLESGGSGCEPRGGNGYGGVINHITINGAVEISKAPSTEAQRWIAVAWAYRAHNLEPKLL